MTCQQDGCFAEATAEVFWPGKTTVQCDEHAEALVRLADFMGFTLSRRPLPAQEPER